MRRLFLLAGLFCVLMVFGQQELTIFNVKGQSSRKVLPDECVLSLSLKYGNKSESESLKGLNELIVKVKTKLKQLDFNENQIKLENFSVYSQNQSKDGKQPDNIYYSTQNLNIRFHVDTKRIIKIYNTLLSNDIKGIEMSFSTEFSDSLRNRIKEELISLSIADAQRKAEMVCKKLDIKIKGIKSISYNTMSDYSGNESFPKLRFSAPVVKRVEDVADNDGMLNFFTINESEIQDEINMTFLLGR